MANSINTFFLISRLLGPSAAADILQLSNSLPLQSRGRARLLVGNEDVHIIARSDDELLDDFFHEQSSTGGQAGENDLLMFLSGFIYFYKVILWINTKLKTESYSVFRHSF